MEKQMSDLLNDVSRRDFLRLGSITAAAAAIPELRAESPAPHAATWSAPAPLSRASGANGSAPEKFPDFTRGLWRQRTASQIATQA